MSTRTRVMTMARKALLSWRATLRPTFWRLKVTRSLLSHFTSRAKAGLMRSLMGWLRMRSFGIRRRVECPRPRVGTCFTSTSNNPQRTLDSGATKASTSNRSNQQSTTPSSTRNHHPTTTCHQPWYWTPTTSPANTWNWAPAPSLPNPTPPSSRNPSSTNPSSPSPPSWPKTASAPTAARWPAPNPTRIRCNLSSKTTTMFRSPT